METMNSIQAAEHQRDLRHKAHDDHSEPRTQVRRWVQLKHVFGSGEERWGRAERRVGADPACATC